MTTSHLLGLITFGIFALFAILAWVLSNKHPAITGDPKMRRKTRRMALLLPAIGVALGYGAFTINNRVAVVTLYEVMAEGSLGVAPETAAPVRNLLFEVEHPGVEHDLMVSPTSKLFQSPSFAVDVSISLHGPTGEPLVPERTERFVVVGSAGTRRKADWEAKHFHFTPVAAGSHTIQVTPITTGIPTIHIRVADPLKRDGKRIAGY